MPNTTGTPTMGAFINISATTSGGAGAAAVSTTPVVIGFPSQAFSTSGGSATSASVVIHGQLAAGASVTVDLNSFSSLGATLTLAKVHGFCFYNASTSGATTVACGASNGFVGGAIKSTTGWNVDAASAVAQMALTTAGWTVDGTHKTVTFDNTAGNGVFYFAFAGE